MGKQLLIRQGGGAADEVDVLNLDDEPREKAPAFDGDTPAFTLGMRWEQGTAARGQFMFTDPGANSTYRFRPHATVKLVETATAPDAVLAWGRIEGGNDVGRRTPTGIGGDEVEHQSIQYMDANDDFSGLPFADEWVRPAEDSWDRLQALHAAKLNGSSSTSALHRATTNIGLDRFTNDHLVDATDPVDLDAKTYPVGTTIEEVMSDIMEEWGKGWGITIHHGPSDSHRCILVQDYDDLATFTSALKISDQIADWNPTHATAPVLEPIWRSGAGKRLDNTDVISGLISIYGGTDEEPRSLTVETGEAPEDWEIWWDVYHDDLAENETQATRRANHVLNDRKRPYTSNACSILLEPTQVKLITAGQAIQVKSVVINQGALKHDYVWRRIAQILWEPSYDGRWWAHLELDRPRNARPRSGGSQPGSTSPKPPPECIPVPDDVVTILSDSSIGDWGSTVTTGSCWGGTPHRAIGASGQNSPIVAVTAGDVIVGALNFREETGDAPWENVDNYNYEAYLQFFGPSMPGLSWEIINQRYHNAGCIDVNPSVTQTVPAGYTEARVTLVGRLGGYRFNGTISLVDAADVPENDEFCVNPGSGGSSPYHPRSDDPRFDADDQHLITRLSERVTNNSGGLLEAGDVVIPDITFDGQGVTTTTTAATTDARVGVMAEDVAADEVGVVIWEGVIPSTVVLNDGASTSADGDYVYTSTTAGAVSVNATRDEGAVARIIRDDAGDPSYVLWWGVPDMGGGGGGGHELLEAGTPLAQRAGMNFLAGFDLTDDAGNDETEVAIDFGESGDITDQAFGDTADAGVLAEAARADHLHGMPSDPANQFAALTLVIGNGIDALATGVKGYVRVPFACTIVRWTLLADVSGSIVVDVWADDFASFPPTDADSITASALPTLSSAQSDDDTTLTGWTTSLAEGDVLAFNVDSVTTIEQVTLELRVQRV